jgi:N-acetylglutamate synthase-like GNAT family acetyltransferase
MMQTVEQSSPTPYLRAGAQPLPRFSFQLCATPARPGDVVQIEQLLYQRYPQCVPLERTDIVDRLDQFQVVRNGHLVIANVALQPVDDEHHELCSLAVAPGWEGLGLGARMVRWAQDEARDLGLSLLCVTTSRNFFSRFGFREVPLAMVPEKPARKDWPIDEKRIAMQWRPEPRLLDPEKGSKQ